MYVNPMAWNWHRTGTQQLVIHTFPFAKYKTWWHWRYQWAGEKGRFGGERLSKCQSSSPLAPSNDIMLEISDQCREHTFPAVEVANRCGTLGQVIVFDDSSLKLKISNFKFSDPSVQNVTIFGGKTQCHFFSNFLNYVSYTVLSPTSIICTVCSPLRAPDAIPISGTVLFVWKSAIQPLPLMR